jgi:hypothetical protein
MLTARPERSAFLEAVWTSRELKELDVRYQYLIVNVEESSCQYFSEIS